jgi:hypothetical protein
MRQLRIGRISLLDLQRSSSDRRDIDPVFEILPVAACIRCPRPQALRTEGAS